MDKDKPYTTSVFQHGTFEPMQRTYGSDRMFPSKTIVPKQPPSYGPFRIGNLPRKGFNKTVGKNFEYIEDPIEDTVTF